MRRPGVPSQEVLIEFLAAIKKFQYDPTHKLQVLAQDGDPACVERPGQIPSPHDRRAGKVSSKTLADSRNTLANLEKQLEESLDRELLGLAMRRVEKQVKPITWQAFRLTAIENRHGADAAKELKMPVAHVFVARYRVQRMLEEEVRFLKESPCRSRGTLNL